jgi:hypothetical protein
MVWLMGCEGERRVWKWSGDGVRLVGKGRVKPRLPGFSKFATGGHIDAKIKLM